MFQIIVLVIVGIIAVCAEVVLIVWMLVTRHQAKALAGLRLGLKIGIGKVPEPPRSRDGYEAWCRRYGVEPYAANAPKHIAAELTEES